MLPYSGYVLDNWGKLDDSKGIDLDNIYMIQNFLSGQDEAWFVLIHVAIEAKAGGVLARMGGGFGVGALERRYHQGSKVGPHIAIQLYKLGEWDTTR